MKVTGVIILLLIVPNVWGQTTYTSPFTQVFPSGLIEEISRSITITEKEILIISDTPEGKDIQSLLIQQKELNEDNLPEYFCTSQDGLFTTVVVLNLNDPPYLEVFQPLLNEPEMVRHIRFLLD